MKASGQLYASNPDLGHVLAKFLVGYVCTLSLLDEFGRRQPANGLENPVKCGFGIKATLISYACKGKCIVLSFLDFLFKSVDSEVIYILVEVHVHSFVQYIRTLLFGNSKIIR